MELKEYILRKYYDDNNIFSIKVVVNGKRSGISHFNGKYGEVIGTEKRKLGWQPFYLIKIEGLIIRVYEKEFDFTKEEKDKFTALKEEEDSYYSKTPEEILEDSYNEFSDKLEKMTKEELLKAKSDLDNIYRNCDGYVKALFIQPISMVDLTLKLKFGYA